MNLLNQRATAAYLSISERTLERWRVTGTGPAFCKLNRRVMYRETDLIEWINGRVRHSTSERYND